MTDIYARDFTLVYGVNHWPLVAETVLDRAERQCASTCGTSRALPDVIWASPQASAFGLTTNGYRRPVADTPVSPLFRRRPTAEQLPNPAEKARTHEQSQVRMDGVDRLERIVLGTGLIGRSTSHRNAVHRPLSDATKARMQSRLRYHELLLDRIGRDSVHVMPRRSQDLASVLASVLNGSFEHDEN